MTMMTIVNPALGKGSGLLANLEKEISTKEVRKLERLGYIENAISPKGVTWKLSAKGKRMRKYMLERRGIRARLSDFFYRHILKFRASL